MLSTSCYNCCVMHTIDITTRSIIVMLVVMAGMLSVLAIIIFVVGLLGLVCFV